jgi:hypothetical protein
MQCLGPTFSEQVAGGSGSGGREVVEPSARFAGLGVLIFPPADDPGSIFKAVEHAIDGGPGSLRRLHDRPAVQLGVVVKRAKEDLNDVEKRTGNPDRTLHDA